jgi:hypothetical protein
MCIQDIHSRNIVIPAIGCKGDIVPQYALIFRFLGTVIECNRCVYTYHQTKHKQNYKQQAKLAVILRRVQMVSVGGSVSEYF